MENYFRMNLTKQEIDAISNLGLAHMGDCVFEILCRGYLCAKGETTVDRLHRDTISLVKATSQAKFVDKLLPLLTEEETAYYRRGKMPTFTRCPSRRPRLSTPRPRGWRHCSGHCIWRDRPTG